MKTETATTLTTGSPRRNPSVPPPLPYTRHVTIQRSGIDSVGCWSRQLLEHCHGDLKVAIQRLMETHTKAAGEPHLDDLMASVRAEHGKFGA